MVTVAIGFRAAALARNDECASSSAANWRDGQISKSLSSPSRKNILLASSGKSSL
jgi:hypothetical protein